MKSKETNVPIVVAIIGLISALGVAIIYNWDNIRPQPTPTPMVAETSAPPTSTSTILPSTETSAPPTSTSIIPPPTETAAPPTATLTPVPSFTPTPSPTLTSPPPLPSAYIILYKDDSFRGSTLRIDLDNCGKVNIDQNNDLHDSTSSFILYAPSNVEIVLVQHHTYDGDYPGKTGIWRGNDGSLQVNKDELIAQGVHDNVSSIQWLINGLLLNDRTCP